MAFGLVEVNPTLKAEPPRINRITGVILAGGRSSRFGSDKTLAFWKGKPLIQNTADILVGLFSSCLVVTNSPASHEFLGWPMQEDICSGVGPLGGIHTALKKITNPRAFIVASDMPLLSSVLIRFLCDLSETEDWDIVMPWLDVGPEPLFAIYSKAILPTIEKNLKQNILQPRALIKNHRVRKVKQSEILSVIDDLSPFYNVNRLEDLAEIQKLH